MTRLLGSETTVGGTAGLIVADSHNDRIRVIAAR